MNVAVNEIVFHVGQATCSCCSLICFGLIALACAVDNFAVGVGSTTQLTATGTYSNGTTKNMTTSCSWSSNSTAVATVQTAGQTSPGLTTGISPGSCNISAHVQAVRGGDCKFPGLPCEVGIFACLLGGTATTLSSFTITVASTPVSGETNSCDFRAKRPSPGQSD